MSSFSYNNFLCFQLIGANVPVPSSVALSPLQRRWLVLDGPVEPLWIENLNSLLDDNRRLCLPSGESLQLPLLMNIIIETPNLLMASPATTTRCGMIYFEPKQQAYQADSNSCYTITNSPQAVGFSRGEKFLASTSQPSLSSSFNWKSILDHHLVNHNNFDISTLERNYCVVLSL